MGVAVRARVVAAVAVAAVLVPIVRGPAHDSFPLSTYPMFARERTGVASIATVFGVAASGRHLTLSPEVIADTDEVILAAETVNRAVGRGPAATADLCADVAARVAEPGGPGGVRALEVVTARYDVVDYLRGDTEPLEVAVHARCRIPR